jgi:MarR family transcriptional regulator, organic hydroperoxide resistance regulator
VGRLQKELKQNKPFTSLESEVYLNLARTADVLQRWEVILLKPVELTASQYNILRILRGAGTEGHRCAEIGARMITRDPDITRLLDRLERRGLVRRAREARDRRAVTTRITEAGLKLLAELDEPIESTQRKILGHMSRGDLETLNRLLEAVRSQQPEEPL